ncbi:hypothetical protein [Xylocopilactobacillus apis]|uniref:Uncharacterized protein n=1 Tax=Xylocopilactobacillus apis TaxID=2932183 RepID=A0AAU9CWQ7_9LACO|nr:hypothetical protein [Xylocopilactobacillus apis]BDR56871.1 hypothetical protein KIMC2_14330 [Xylocopilactobacillus apis]
MTNEEIYKKAVQAINQDLLDKTLLIAQLQLQLEVANLNAEKLIEENKKLNEALSDLRKEKENAKSN